MKRIRALLFDAVAQDLRQAVRIARGHAGFSAKAMLTLSLGIGPVAVVPSSSVLSVFARAGYPHVAPCA